MQMVTSATFRPFDYGPRENLRRYGARTPPSYRCACTCVHVHGGEGLCVSMRPQRSAFYGLCDVSVHLVSGARDFLVHSQDIAHVCTRGRTCYSWRLT